jgi:hypothetical protein
LWTIIPRTFVKTWSNGRELPPIDEVVGKAVGAVDEDGVGGGVKKVEVEARPEHLNGTAEGGGGTAGTGETAGF